MSLFASTDTARGEASPVSQDVTEQQTDLLFGLIHVGPNLLHQFLDATERDICLIKEFFSDPESAKDYRSMIDSILRVTHGIKGSATLFDLTLYTRQIEDIEGELVRLKNNNSPLSIESFSMVIEVIDATEKALLETQNLLQELIRAKLPAANEITKTQVFIQNASSLIVEFGQATKKKVILHYGAFDLDMLPEKYYQLSVDIFVQLIRNALAHAIEPPAERSLAGKHECGNLYLTCERTDTFYQLSVQDDGNGLDLQRLKRQVTDTDDDTKPSAIKAGVKLAKLIFQPGFSTMKTASKEGGRGVGLDMVHQLVSDADGSIEFKFSPGNGCLFKVYLPL